MNITLEVGAFLLASFGYALRGAIGKALLDGALRLIVFIMHKGKQELVRDYEHKKALRRSSTAL